MIFFDLETTNKSFGSALMPENQIVMVSWAVGRTGKIKNFTGDILDAKEFWKDMREADAACAFNCKFELLWMKRCGFDVDKIKWFDPMLAEKVVLGNVQLPMNQDAVCQRYGFEAKDLMIDTMMKNGICPSDMPQKRLRARCNRDVRTMRSLHYALENILKAREQVHLYRNRCDFAVVLAHIEANGMQLDPKLVQDNYDKYAKLVADLKAQLDEITGGINLNSPDQKADFLYRKLKFPEKRGAGGRKLRNKPSKQFPDGRPKTDKDTMAWLMGRANTDEQREFVTKQMAYSKANAALSKNLDFFRGVCLEHGGRFHAQFNQTVAATHRLTSSGMPLVFDCYDGKKKSVQFQNMPREFKGCFDAPDGYKVCEVDAMQLEFRVAAFCGQDSQAKLDIADPDFDAHCRSASVMQNIRYEDFLRCYRNGDKKFKAWRQGSKADTFKPLYGGTKGTPEQERYYKSFAERYNELVAVQETWLADVCRTGELVTPWGMRFTWDVFIDKRGVPMNKKTFKPVGPQVYNYPVQNLATAEIVPIAITALYRRCKEEDIDVKFVNTIHDSVICYVRDDVGTISRFREAAEWAFTTAVYEHLSIMYQMEFNVPLGMEMVIGDHWNSGEESVYDDVNNEGFNNGKT